MISTAGSIQLVNMLHQLRMKANRLDAEHKLSRQWKRIDELLEVEGLIVDVPLGQGYDPSRTDLEVTMNSMSESAAITEVIKPVIYHKSSDGTKLVQRGIVIVG